MARSDVLVDADWVEAHLDDPKVVIVEVDEDTAAYDKNHIKGASRLDWKRDLQDPIIRDFVSQEKFGIIWAFNGETPTYDLPDFPYPEHELVIRAVGDAHHPPPGRLRLVRDDRDLAAGEGVHERRLPDVRPPGNRDEPASQRPTPPPRVGKDALRPRR